MRSPSTLIKIWSASRWVLQHSPDSRHSLRAAKDYCRGSNNPAALPEQIALPACGQSPKNP